MSAARFLPGDRPDDMPADWEPSADGLPPIGGQIGTAVDSALLLLEGRRWWLEHYHVDAPARDAELAALTIAITALEQALEHQPAGRQ